VTTTSAPLAPALRAQSGGPVRVVHAGTVAYHSAWQWQRELAADRLAGHVDDTFLLLEHPAVYTLGKRTDRRHLLWDASQCAANGISVVEVDRGGDVTYHGPGQLVGYPIVRLASLRSVVSYVRTLETVLIAALQDFGVEAQRVDGYTGVWVDDAKIAAIGVRVGSGGITSHGFALNVAPNLRHFSGIVPCGIPDRDVCSLESLGVDTPMEAVTTAIERQFAQAFDATLEHVPASAARSDYPAIFARQEATAKVYA
jgi:lipoyl(octanoyl) transferase